MNDQLNNLKETVSDLRDAVLQQDVMQVHENTQKINLVANEIFKRSPGELSEVERELVNEIINLSRETNILLVQQLDFTRMAIEDLTRRGSLKQDWYA